MEHTARTSVTRGFRLAPLPLLAAVAVVLGALGVGGGRALLMWGVSGAAFGAVLTAALTAFYLMPGLALLRLFWPVDRPLHPAARLGLAIGLSAALPPLLLLLVSTVGLGWGAIQTWGYLLTSAAIAVAPRGLPFQWRLADIRPRLTRLDSATVALLIVFSAALVIRFFIIRDLPAGLLGDSYHHTLMAQLLFDHGGLFQSWQPYAPLTTFTYHFGFHANVALFSWLTGIDVIHSVLYIGQALNAAIAPVVFTLTVTMLRARPWAGVWAALVAVAVMTLPAQYVIWGRYTQLTGQIVGVALLVCWAALSEPRATGATPWRLIVLAALTGAAMMLTHYLVSIVIAVFLASFLLADALARRDSRATAAFAVRLLAAGVGALVLASPWLYNLGSGYLTRNASGLVSGSAGAGHIAQFSTLPLDMTPLYAKSYVLLGAAAGLCLAAWRREWRIAFAGVWSVLAVLVVAPYLVGLPGAGVVDQITALSSWFLTLSPLAGYAMAGLQQAGRRAARYVRLPSFAPRAAAILLASAVLAWGTAWQARLIDGSTQLVTQADMAAMDWIRANTPADARFLVNSFPAYSGNLIAGTDAGWWLPLLTGRQTTLPPLTYGSERGPTRDYAHQVNSIAAALRERPLTDPRPIAIDLTTADALAVLRDHHIQYIYSGAHSYPPNVDQIDTAALHADSHFRPVYARDGVEIFEVVAP